MVLTLEARNKCSGHLEQIMTEWIYRAEAMAGIVSQIKQGKRLQLNQETYIVNLFENIESGSDILSSIQNTKLIVTPKGRAGALHQKALNVRNESLKKAVSLLKGTPNDRCKQLDLIIEQVEQDFNAGKFEQCGNVEKIIRYKQMYYLCSGRISSA